MNKKASFTVIFLTVFIDLMGFGILMPILPTFASKVLMMYKTIRGAIVNNIVMGSMDGVMRAANTAIITTAYRHCSRKAWAVMRPTRDNTKTMIGI